MKIPSPIIAALLLVQSVQAGSCCQAAPAEAVSVASDSLFNISGTWTNQEGAAAELDSWGGSWHVVGMFYSSCISICPRLTSDMKDIEASLPTEIRQKVGFELISMDPTRDTPDAMKAYANEHELDPARWHLWQGAPDNIRTLAAALGVAYRILPSGDISHSTPILLVDPDGRVDLRIEDFDKPRQPLIDRLIQKLGTAR